MPMLTTVVDRPAHQSNDNANNKEMEQRLSNVISTKEWNRTTTRK